MYCVFSVSQFLSAYRTRGVLWNFILIRTVNAVNLKRIKKNQHPFKMEKGAFFNLHLPKNVL